MTSALKISEATSLAFHAMALLSAEPERRHPARELAGTLCVSEAHLAKVMQRLAKQGFVESVRGPGGGFRMGADAGEATLLEIFEAIEGPFSPSNCLLGGMLCGGQKCILGELVKTVNEKVLDYLSQTRLGQLADVYQG
jgi:Rrf2 family protein